MADARSLRRSGSAHRKGQGTVQMPGTRPSGGSPKLEPGAAGSGVVIVLDRCLEKRRGIARRSLPRLTSTAMGWHHSKTSKTGSLTRSIDHRWMLAGILIGRICRLRRRSADSFHSLSMAGGWQIAGLARPAASQVRVRHAARRLPGRGRVLRRGRRWRRRRGSGLLSR